jgi:hypothetical protein
MRATYSVTITRPLSEVWHAFDDTDFQRRWQITLQSIEHVSGSPGQVGAVSRRTYREAGRDIVIVETVTRRTEREEYASSFEAAMGPSTIHNRFAALPGDKTRWTMDTESRYRGIWRLLGPLAWPLAVRRFRADMERFQALIEQARVVGTP